MAHAHTEHPIAAVDAHAFVAKLFSGVPEGDRVEAMERYILVSYFSRDPTGEDAKRARFEGTKKAIAAYERSQRSESDSESESEDESESESDE